MRNATVARCREYFQEQARLLSISLTQQIRPGRIEHTINYLVDNDVDLGVFDSRYRNDATGAPAIDPAIPLKNILLFARNPQQSSDRTELRRERGVHGLGLRHPTSFHRAADTAPPEPGQQEKEKRAIENLQAKAAKIRSWLDTHEKRIGSQGKPVKSSI
jgi:hypothetical protein